MISLDTTHLAAVNAFPWSAVPPVDLNLTTATLQVP